MPRGVPNSGRRQPRVFPAGQPPAETSVAARAVDDEARVETPADPPAYLAFEPAEDVIEIPVLDEAEPVEEVEPQLTAEQKEILLLREQLAQLQGQRDVEPVVEDLANPGDASNILIHFLEDGFSALGQVWYRGQELEFDVNSQAYRDTFNKNGVSWLDYRNDEFGQVDRFGKIMFRNGPWPGKTYRDGSYEPLRQESGDGTVPPPSKEQIEAAERARKRRAAPKLPAIV